jgi:hypothetical protein
MSVTIDVVAIAIVKQALDDPEVRDRIRTIVMEVLPAQPDPLEHLVDSRAAAKVLGMTQAALRQAVYRGTIPCEIVGRRLRFRPSLLRGC